MEARALYAWLWLLHGQKTLRDQHEGVARKTSVELNYLEWVSLEVSRLHPIRLPGQNPL